MGIAAVVRIASVFSVECQPAILSARGLEGNHRDGQAAPVFRE